MEILHSIILGAVEGLTEFLPVSSTGHMILSAKVMGLEQTPALKCFEVAIQLGSILAVVATFFARLRRDFTLWTKLAIGFVPTAVIGFLLYKHIKTLFEPETVAYALIFWGAIFIVVELWHKLTNYEARTTHISQITYKQAFLVGLSQCFAMVPGTSRSGATIIAGLLCGLSREIAAAFSFLLAVPTMFAATVYDSYKNRAIFVENADNIWIFLLGGAVAFLVALAVIKLFMRFIAHFTYISFGVYRIIVGLVFIFFVF